MGANPLSIPQKPPRVLYSGFNSSSARRQAGINSFLPSPKLAKRLKRTPANGIYNDLFASRMALRCPPLLNCSTPVLREEIRLQVPLLSARFVPLHPNNHGCFKLSSAIAGGFLPGSPKLVKIFRFPLLYYYM